MMSSWRLMDASGRRLAGVLVVVVLLTGGAVAQRLVASSAPTPATSSAPTPATSKSAHAGAPSVPPRPAVALAVPAALTDGTLGLRAGPVGVPLELHLPTLGVRASVAGVGITAKNVMDAPIGPPGDPVWQQTFWYRGSAVPGELSTALIAGHVNGPLGQPAVFARIGDLQPGDPITVRDRRSGLDVRFSVTGSKIYSLDEAADPAVLARIYGAGPVAGTTPQASADGLAHLTLITCAGTFRNGTHDHRLVVYAARDA